LNVPKASECNTWFSNGTAKNAKAIPLNSRKDTYLIVSKNTTIAYQNLESGLFIFF